MSERRFFVAKEAKPMDAQQLVSPCWAHDLSHNNPTAFLRLRKAASISTLHRVSSKRRRGVLPSRHKAGTQTHVAYENAPDDGEAVKKTAPTTVL